MNLIKLPTTFRVYHGKMVMVLTTLKIATQFLNEWFHTTPFDVNVSFNKDGSCIFQNQDGTVDDKSIKQLQKIFNGRERGIELVVLTRDPLKRFISAFNQDYIKPIFRYKASTAHLNIMMEYIIKDNHSYVNFPYTKEERMAQYLELHRNRKLHDVQTNDDYIQSMSKEYLEFLCFNIITRVTSDADYEVFKSHNGEWNTPLLQLLSFVKDSNVVRVIDIDNQNLSAALSKYEIGTKTLDPIHTSKNIGPILQDVFKKTHRNINELLQTEILSYTILKNKWGDKNL